MLQLLTCTHLRDNILTEQQMMEDKIKATDWEATNEAIEEQVWSLTALIQDPGIENLLLLQVARESYLQWLAEQEKQKKNSKNPPAATVTSGQVSPRGGSSSPRGGSSPRNAVQVTTAFKTLNTQSCVVVRKSSLTIIAASLSFKRNFIRFRFRSSL